MAKTDTETLFNVVYSKEAHMNILIIFTGGTISSSEKGGYIGPDEQNNNRLINEYKKRSPEKCADINFSTSSPYYILSENLTGKHINLLADCIDKALSSDEYDGIIVTHGTDTLQYTAAGLSYIYSDINIPIVLVSSNYILDDSRANGYDNFSAAVDFIMTCCKTPEENINASTEKNAGNNLAIENNAANYNGVYVAYKNENEPAVIHCGARLLSHASYSDKIYSVDNLTATANINNTTATDSINSTTTTGNLNSITATDSTNSTTATGNLNSTTAADNTGSITPCISDNKQPYNKNKTEVEFIFGDKPRFSEHSPVAFIHPYPGERYSLVPEYVRAILLDTYHSGTLCTDSTELKDMLLDAKARNIPVFLTGAEKRTGYESTKVYDELNIKVLPKASPIAMYMKLWLLVSTSYDNISKHMNTPVCCNNISKYMNTPICHDII